MYYLQFYQSTIYIYSVFITSFNIRERFPSVYPLILSLPLTLATITILVDYPYLIFTLESFVCSLLGSSKEDFKTN